MGTPVTASVASILFGALTVESLTGRHFNGTEPAAQQTRRLFESLPSDGRPRLERLNGFGTGALLRPLTGACSRVTLKDETVAVLICGAFFTALRRVMRQELGGDPAVAREVLERVAAGDLPGLSKKTSITTRGQPSSARRFKKRA